MNNWLYRKIGVMLLIGFLLVLGAQPSGAGLEKEVPVKGMVTLVDLGANACIPCKMMAPIMTKLEKDYQGKAAVIFIDVWKFPEQAKPFNIQVIPTQIFYDKTGKEVSRHEGFMSEKDIVGQLKKMGVK
ncbi:MAG: thioredoxin family protein [Thermodesulfobacteriota bacterium]